MSNPEYLTEISEAINAIIPNLGNISDWITDTNNQNITNIISVVHSPTETRIVLQNYTNNFIIIKSKSILMNRYGICVKGAMYDIR